MDPDTLALLEEKIRRAVDTVAQLKKEKEAARDLANDVTALRSQVGTLTAELDSVKAERDTLKSERETVRQRVQKLLDQIDQLNGG
jgi:FtsZ-binding cell division protein ZapB